MSRLIRNVVRAMLVLLLGSLVLTPPNASGTPENSPVVPGVALGDCEDLSVAMARTYMLGRRPPPSADKSCEGGRIRMQVQAERHFGHRLMDPVAIRVLLSIDPSVTIDFQSLSRGTIAFNGQEFDLVLPLALNSSQRPVDIQARRMPDGRRLIKVDLMIQSSVPASVAPHLVFRLDLRYSLGNVRDGEGNETSAPDRRVLSTPVVGLTLSGTATAESEFVGVEPALAPQLRPWATHSLLVTGIFLVLLPPGLWLVRRINGLRPGRKIPPHELAWRVLEKTFAEGKQGGFSPSHFKAISAAVRRYLNVAASTQAELRSLLGEHPQRKAIIRVLSQCDAVLYRSQQLNHEEIVELIEDVENIIPRP